MSPPGASAPSPSSEDDEVALLVSRWANSSAPEHRNLRGILGVLREVIQQQGLSPSPTAYFAAAMAALEREAGGMRGGVEASNKPLAVDAVSEQMGNLGVKQGQEREGSMQPSSSSPEVVSALLDIFHLTLPKLPQAVIRPRAQAVLGLLAVFCSLDDKTREAGQEEEEGQGSGGARVAKCALSGIEGVLPFLETTKWSRELQSSVEAVLNLCIEGKPKVRRKAQFVLCGALSRFVSSAPLHSQASQVVVQGSERVMAAVVAGGGKKKGGVESKEGKRRRQKGQEEGEADVSKESATAVLHLLSCLRGVLPLLSSPALSRMLLRLTELLKLDHPLVSVGVLESLKAVSNPGAATGLPPAVLADVITCLVRHEATWQEQRALQGRKADAAAHSVLLLQVLRGLLGRLYQVDPARCQACLPLMFHTLGENLASEMEEVAYHTGEFLRWSVDSFVDSAVVEQALSKTGMEGEGEGEAGHAAGAPSRTLPVLLRLCSSIESFLGYAPQGSVATEHALRLVTTLFQRVGPASPAVCRGILGSIGEMQELLPPDAALRQQMQAALGAAVEAMRPEVFLEVLPLNLGPQTDLAQARVWVFPLLKRYTVGAELGYFAKHLLPLAVQLKQRAKQAQEQSRAVEQRNLEALVGAIWELLPSFCNLPTDTAAAFPLLARPMAETAAKETVLRPSVVRALKVLIQQNRHALGEGKEEEQEEGDEDIGSEYCFKEENQRVMGAQEDESSKSAAWLRAKEALTPELAQANIDVIRSFSPRFLPILFEAHMAAPENKRADLQEAISQLSSISPLPALKPLFVSVMQKLLAATVEQSKSAAAADEDKDEAMGEGEAGGEKAKGGRKTTKKKGVSSLVARRATLMDLALPLLSGPLDKECFHVLYGATRPALHDKEISIQKRGYKLLSRMLATMPTEMTEKQDEILQEIVMAMGTTHTSARHYRLRCVHLLLRSLLGRTATGASEAEEAIAALLSELMASVKETNRKTREAAYQALLAVAHELEAADEREDRGPMEEGGQRLMRFFSMVLAGLAATTPHMISCTVTALARLLFEFRSQLLHTVPQLLPSVLLLLRSQSREIVKAALGFVKVVAVCLPAEELTPLLCSMVEGLLLWSDDTKNHFKAKVRVIMERFVRRCGEAEVLQYVPEEHKKLIAHIRKARERHRRQKTSSRARGVEGGEQGQEVDRESLRSGASTARRSQWRHSDIFEDESGWGSEEEERMVGSEDGQPRARGGARSSKAGLSGHARSSMGSRAQRKAKAKAMHLAADDTGGAPLDLLDLTKTRSALGGAEGRRMGLKRQREGEDEGGAVRVNEDGKIVVDEEREGGKAEARQKGRALFDPSADASAEQGKGKRRKVADGKQRGVNKKPSVHGYAGAEYSGKKGKGDVKKEGKLDPFAYWPLDARMLNRRRGKVAQARKGMAATLKVGKKKKN